MLMVLKGCEVCNDGSKQLSSMFGQAAPNG
jgi:hypothetical protein